MNIQDWFPLWWTGWISLQSKGFSRVAQHHSSKASILWCSAFFMVQLSHPLMTSGKTIALTTQTFAGRVISLLFCMLSKFSTAFLPRTKLPFFSQLQSLYAVIFGAQENKVCHCFHCFSMYLPWNNGTGCSDFRFLICVYLIKTIPKKMKCKKEKWLSEDALEIT